MTFPQVSSGLHSYMTRARHSDLFRYVVPFLVLLSSPLGAHCQPAYGMRKIPAYTLVKVSE